MTATAVQMQARDGFDPAAFTAAIAAGCAWLQGAAGTQPERAMLTHHGTSVYCGGGISVTVAPHNLVSPGSTTTGLVHVAVRPVNDQHPNRYDPPPLTDTEAASIEQLIATHMPVIDRWGCDAWRSYRVDGVHPDASVLVRRYRASCPVHGHPFCGGWQALNDDEKSCTWSHGFDDTIKPSWIPVPYPQPSAAAPPIDGPLRVVKEAIETWEPRLVGAELTQPGILAAGARGRIDGDTDLEFVEATGVGVTVPAEVFAEMARAWLELDDIESRYR